MVHRASWAAPKQWRWLIISSFNVYLNLSSHKEWARTYPVSLNLAIRGLQPRNNPEIAGEAKTKEKNEIENGSLLQFSFR